MYRTISVGIYTVLQRLGEGKRDYCVDHVHVKFPRTHNLRIGIIKNKKKCVSTLDVFGAGFKTFDCFCDVVRMDILLIHTSFFKHTLTEQRYV